MKTIVKHHEIITVINLLPGYVEDCSSGDIYTVWGRYYKYREYTYDKSSCCGPRRITTMALTFVNREDAEAYSKSRNENIPPC